ncbi:MAG: hypothetical protein AB1416_02455 [Actinomycetota bacterium]
MTSRCTAWRAAALACVAAFLLALPAGARAALIFGPETPLLADDGSPQAGITHLTDGRVLAVAGEHSGDAAPTYSLRSGPAGAWTSAAPIPGLSKGGRVVARPLPGGGALVLHQWRDSNAKGHLESAELAPDGTWGPVQQIADPGDLAQGGFGMVTDAAGNADVVFVSTDAVYVRSVKVASRPSGCAWGAPVTLLTAGLTTSYVGVAIASDPAGDAAAAMAVDSGTGQRVSVARRPAGATWPAAAPITDDAHIRSAPRVVVTPSGEAIVGWYERNADGETLGVRVVRAPAGAGFGPEEPVGGSQDGVADMAVIGGDVFLTTFQLVLQEDGQPANRPGAVYRLAGATWSPELTIPPDVDDSPRPTLVALADERAAVSWAWEIQERTAIALRSSDGTWTRWSVPVAAADYPFAVLLGGWGAEPRFIFEIWLLHRVDDGAVVAAEAHGAPSVRLPRGRG